MKALPIEDLQHVLTHTKEAWNSLKDARIFMTGGTGFFGGWLLETLAFANKTLGLNASVLVLTRDAARFKKKFPHLDEHSAIEVLEGDVRSFDFPKGDFSHVIHAATDVSDKLNAENPLEIIDVILSGTKHVFDFAVQAKAKHVLLTSSGAVYGKKALSLGHIPETYDGSPDIENPASVYGVGKRTAEHLATLYHAQHQLNVKIVRSFALVGPLLPIETHFAIGNFIRDGLQEKPIEINGDGTPYRSYQYAADLAIWLWNILCFGKACYPYNTGSDEELSIADLAKTVSEFFSPTPAILLKKNPIPGATPQYYVPSIDRAREDLGLKNFISLKEGILRTIEWYQKS